MLVFLQMKRGTQTFQSVRSAELHSAVRQKRWLERRLTNLETAGK